MDTVQRYHLKNYAWPVRTVSYLVFTDDLKIFARALSTSDQEDLQRSLTNVGLRRVNNAMELNVAKCRVMTFQGWKYGVDLTTTLAVQLLRRSIVSTTL